MSSWEKNLTESIKDGVVEELHLTRIPTLKACENWDHVKPIGLVDHHTKHAHYKGGLVYYGPRIFFISDRKIDSLSQFLHWKFKKTLKVVVKENKSDKKGK